MELAKLIPDEYDGWKAEGGVERYNRETIFDYIDGAGEVYLLYDFREVAVKRLVGPDSSDITIEIFDMGKPEDAFGIFSHSRENEEAGVGSGSEFRGGFLAFWKGRYFICVYSNKVTDEIDNAVFAIGREIESRITDDSGEPDLLHILPEKGLVEGSVVYFHKQSSLNYHYFLSEDNILGLRELTNAVMARYLPEKATLLCVKYPDFYSAAGAFNNFIMGYIPDADSTGTARIQDGGWVKAARVDSYFIAVFDASDRNVADDLVNAAREKISGRGHE